MPTFVKSHRRGNYTVHAYSRNAHKSLMIKKYQLVNSLVNARSMMRSATTHHSMVKAMNSVSDISKSLKHVNYKLLDKSVMGYKLLGRGRR